MIYVLYVLTALAGLFVLFTLVAGSVSMGKKGQDSRIKSNKWMQRRVLGQAIAFFLLVATIYVKKSGG